MTNLLLGASFLCLWAGITLVLSCMPGFQRRLSLADRLRPYADADDWITDLEAWLKDQ
jgi:hypothetical protein